jgi:hypothetical protein
VCVCVFVYQALSSYTRDIFLHANDFAAILAHSAHDEMRWKKEEENENKKAGHLPY